MKLAIFSALDLAASAISPVNNRSTVDQLFSSEIAESAKSKAENIASLMSYKMEMDTKLRKL